MNHVAETEVFNVTRDFTYHAFLLFFQGPNDHPRFVGKGSLAGPELEELLRRGLPIVKEWEYPKTLTVEQLNGPVILRNVLRLVGIASRTVVVSWEYSLHPQNFLGSVLTAVPRMRLSNAAPEIKAALRRLKVEFEGHAYDSALEHTLASDELSKLDPPEGFLRTVIDADIWHRGMTLLEAATYFEVLREELGPAAAHFEQLSEELRAAGRLHLIYSSDEVVTEARLDAVRRAYVENFARLALSEHAYDQQLLSLMMPYFMSLKKKMDEVGAELPRMSVQAAGNRTAMAKMLLEYAAPDFAEMNRIAEGMRGSDGAIPFRQWAERRRAAAVPLPSRQAGAPATTEIELTCAWRDSESLLRELAPYAGEGVKFEVRNRGPRFRGEAMDTAVLVALISAGQVAFNVLITSLIQWRLKTKADGASRIVIKVSNESLEIDVPRDFNSDQIHELVAPRVREFQELTGQDKSQRRIHIE
jgi:hypothetical protein